MKAVDAMDTGTRFSNGVLFQDQDIRGLSPAGIALYFEVLKPKSDTGAGTKDIFKTGSRLVLRMTSPGRG